MESNNMIDMSLDEIIKLNKQSKMANARKAGTGKRARLMANARKEKRVGTTLAQPMKSKRVSTARTILAKARRTAAMAAKVAADAAALASPASGSGGSKRSWLNANANGRGNKKITTSIAWKKKQNVALKRISATRIQGARRQQQRLLGRGGRGRGVGVTVDLRSRLDSRPHLRRGRPQLQRQLQQRQTISGGNVLRRRGGRRSMNTSVAAPPSRYQQYIEQARALIQAQNERNNTNSNAGNRGFRGGRFNGNNGNASPRGVRGGRFGRNNNNASARDFSRGGNNRNNNSIYVDVPARNGGASSNRNANVFRRNGARGRFRR